MYLLEGQGKEIENVKLTKNRKLHFQQITTKNTNFSIYRIIFTFSISAYFLHQ